VGLENADVENTGPVIHVTRKRFVTPLKIALPPAIYSNLRWRLI